MFCMTQVYQTTSSFKRLVNGYTHRSDLHSGGSRYKFSNESSQNSKKNLKGWKKLSPLLLKELLWSPSILLMINALVKHDMYKNHEIYQGAPNCITPYSHTNSSVRFTDHVHIPIIFSLKVYSNRSMKLKPAWYRPIIGRIIYAGDSSVVYRPIIGRIILCLLFWPVFGISGSIRALSCMACMQTSMSSRLCMVTCRERDGQIDR